MNGHFSRGKPKKIPRNQAYCSYKSQCTATVKKLASPFTLLIHHFSLSLTRTTDLSTMATTSQSPTLKPQTSHKTYTHIGRGGGGNIFQTQENKSSPKLVPVSSTGHTIPADQKKFSIARGGYGNIKENKPNPGSAKNSPNITPENEEDLVQSLTPLDSVRSIGRGGFGNQIKNIKSKEQGDGKKGTGVVSKLKKFFK